MDEIWIETNNKSTDGRTIIKISNRGRIWRKNGKKEESTLRQKISKNGKMTFIYRIIAEHFINKTEEDKALCRDCIDHITHNPPIGMNINDVRNLRWCTNKENHNFYECRNNMSKAKLNKSKSEFGRKYYEHYGYSRSTNINQYDIEKAYYYYHGKCRWE